MSKRKRPRIPSGNVDNRINVSVPRWMRLAMLLVDGVNWSGVAQEAFARVLAGQPKPTEGKDCRP